MAVDKKVVDEQIKALGDFDQWFTKKEMKYLPEIIDAGEQIKAMTSGVHEGNTWLIVATDRRLLFLDKGMIYGLKQMEMPLAQITTLSHKTGLMFGEIEIDTAGGKKKIETIVKKDVAKFADIVSGLVKKVHSNDNVAPSPQVDVATQLEKLAELKSKGILTEEEFQEQKTKLLSQ